MQTMYVKCYFSWGTMHGLYEMCNRTEKKSPISENVMNIECLMYYHSIFHPCEKVSCVFQHLRHSAITQLSGRWEENVWISKRFNIYLCTGVNYSFQNVSIIQKMNTHQTVFVTVYVIILDLIANGGGNGI